MYIDDDGMVNIAERLIKQLRYDYVKGGKLIKKQYGYLPTQKEAMEDKLRWKRLMISDGTRAIVRNFYSAWRFVEEDPYELFVNVVRREIFNDWDKDIDS